MRKPNRTPQPPLSPALLDSEIPYEVMIVLSALCSTVVCHDQFHAAHIHIEWDPSTRSLARQAFLKAKKFRAMPYLGNYVYRKMTCPVVIGFELAIFQMKKPHVAMGNCNFRKCKCAFRGSDPLKSMPQPLPPNISNPTSIVVSVNLSRNTQRAIPGC